jgi:hypothetical protein
MYTKLKCALLLILTTSVLFVEYNLLSLFGICLAIKVLKRQRGLIYITNVAKLKLTNRWKGRSLRFPTIRARENCCYTAIVLEPLLYHKSKLCKGLLCLFCTIAKGDMLSSKEPLKPRIRKLETKILLASCFRVLNYTVRVELYLIFCPYATSMCIS